MIGYLKGEVIDSGEDYLIVNTGGVGYKVETEAPHRLGLLGHEIEVRIFTHVREREIRLFGFPSNKELMLFERLLDVSGVGPKSAMSIVSTYSVGQIISAITNNEPKKMKVKGVGKKTLAKIVIELSGKLEKIKQTLITEGKAEGKDVPTEEEVTMQLENSGELVSALETLGYRESDVEQIIEDIDQDKSISAQIKQALSLLN